jgi:hypothetical protein
MVERRLAEQHKKVTRASTWALVQSMRVRRSLWLTACHRAFPSSLFIYHAFDAMHAKGANRGAYATSYACGRACLTPLLTSGGIGKVGFARAPHSR